MRPVLSRQQIRDFDAYWIERGVLGILLMENAGRGAAHLIGLKARPRREGEARQLSTSVAGSCIRCADERALSGLTFVILCGPGNNGGDGFVVARHLMGRGALVRVYSVFEQEKFRGDALVALRAMQALGLSLLPLPEKGAWPEIFDGATLLVDALLGTGADREVEGELRDLILAMNASPTPTISLDIPSGLNADDGAVLGVAVQARHTITFAHLKRGLLTTEGQRCAGTLTTAQIGVPANLPSSIEPAAWLLEESDLLDRFQPRAKTVHKGTVGHVVVVAGSPGTVGAARLSAHGSLRSGAGLVTISTDEKTVLKLDGEVMEVMTRPWSDGDGDFFGGAGALVLGPGIGPSQRAASALSLALGAHRPTVLDADGLRWLAQVGPLTLHRLTDASLLVLTPHSGEAAALLGQEVSQIESDRFGAVERLTEKYGSTVVLKGSRTLIATPGRKPVVCAFGSPALATAGSGDVLSGILGTLLIGAETQSEVFERAQMAVSVHAICGERWAETRGDRGLLASEIADEVPGLFQQWACLAHR